MKRLGLVEDLLVLKREGQQHHRRTRLGVLADVHRGIGRHPINTAPNRPGKAIKVGGGASLIAITPNDTTAYFVVGNNLVPINTANNQIGRAIRARNPAGRHRIHAITVWESGPPPAAAPTHFPL